MRLTRRKLLQYISATVASLALNKILPASAEEFYVRAPIIVGHDMDVESERARFMGTITNAIKRGYTPVSIYDLLMPIVSGFPLDVTKPFVVTLDDGYLSQLYLLDFFQKNGVNAAYFVIPTYQDGSHKYIEISSYQEITSAGHYIGAHTTRHRNLSQMKLDDFVEDVLLSRMLIEDAIGEKCNIFAYPTGSFSDDLLERLASNGFVSAVSTVGGVSKYKSSGGKIIFRNSPVEHTPENALCLNRVYAFV